MQRIASPWTDLIGPLAIHTFIYLLSKLLKIKSRSEKSQHSETSTRNAVVLPGGEVPTYFTFRSNGSYLTVKLNEKPPRYWFCVRARSSWSHQPINVWIKECGSGYPQFMLTKIFRTSEMAMNILNLQMNICKYVIITLLLLCFASCGAFFCMASSSFHRACKRKD